VDTSVFTSFYLGVLTNQAAVRAKIETPHFEILFKVSYGLDRDVLEDINGSLRHGRWRTKNYDKDDKFKRVS
jgi:DNA ligase-4